MTSVVYFVRAASQAVKIGWTADLNRRMQNLRSGTSEDLHIAATFPGGADLEAHFHERFENQRLRGEWFGPSPALDELILSIVGGVYSPPAGYSSVARTERGFDLARAAREAREEAHRLVGIIAGEAAMGDKVKTGLSRVVLVTGLGARRVRAFWNREAGRIASEEMDRLREVAAIRVRRQPADHRQAVNPAGGADRQWEGPQWAIPTEFARPP